jgi:transcriptional regulator with XRE-family HTH domain
MKPVSKIDRYVIKKTIEMRLAKGITQAQLSHELDVHVGFIGQVESDKSSKKYSLERLEQIANFLKCNIADFLPSKKY